MVNEIDDDFELVTDDADPNASEASLLVEATPVESAGYYVLFDKSTGVILSIGHEPYTLTDKTGELYLAGHKDLDAIFSNKLNIDKLKVKYDLSKKSYVLTASKDFSDLFVNEFILVDIEPTENFIMDVKFNLVTKNVYFKLNYKMLSFYLSTQTPEHVLELTNKNIVFYLFDKLNPTLLYDKYEIHLKTLIDNEFMIFKADWLDLMRTHTFSLLTSNVGFNVNLSIDEQYVKDHLDYEVLYTEQYPETPMIKLNVAYHYIELESMITDPRNFKIDEEFYLYIFKEGEPDTLLRKYVINRNELGNQNKFILDNIGISGRVSAVCNPEYIKVETNIL
jgi:hypothetical protein